MVTVACFVTGTRTGGDRSVCGLLRRWVYWVSNERTWCHVSCKWCTNDDTTHAHNISVHSCRDKHRNRRNISCSCSVRANRYKLARMRFIWVKHHIYLSENASTVTGTSTSQCSNDVIMKISQHCRRIVLPQPVSDLGSFERRRFVSPQDSSGVWRAHELTELWWCRWVYFDIPLSILPCLKKTTFNKVDFTCSPDVIWK